MSDNPYVVVQTPAQQGQQEFSAQLQKYLQSQQPGQQGQQGVATQFGTTIGQGMGALLGRFMPAQQGQTQQSGPMQLSGAPILQGQPTQGAPMPFNPNQTGGLY